MRGGTGVDVMKNVPGLGVDVEGNVTLRNASPQILIDGRPTTILLEQIPSEEIERVEVITTPGAQFDANTTGGIVNVVLKKSTKPGYSGQLEGGAGTNGRYQASGNLRVKEDPFAFTLGGNLRLNDNTTDSRTDRTDRVDGHDAGYFEQDGDNDSKRLSFGGRAGVDWSVSQSYNERNYDNSETQQFVSRDGSGAITSQGEQLNEQDNGGREMGTRLGFRHNAPKEGKEWTADMVYNRSDRNSRSTFNTMTRDAEGIPLGGSPRVQYNDGSTTSDNFNFQLDVVVPRNERTKVDWGVKASHRRERSLLNVLVSDSLEEAMRDTSLSNDYRITDIVNAAYINWAHKLGERWSVQAGLRIEQTWFEAQLVEKGLNYGFRYPDGSEDLDKTIFPSLYFSRKWEGTREFQFNLSRKINRPNFWQVMPFVFFSDSRSYRIGNPALGPEMTEIGEVNHPLPFGKGRSNWLTSLFMRHTGNVITNYVYPKPDEPEVLVTTYVNGGDSWSYGWDNIIRFEPRTGSQVTVSGVMQYIEVGLGSGVTSASNSGIAANDKVNVSQRFTKDWVVQLNAEYEGPRPIPQGTTLDTWGIDLSVSKDVNKSLNIVVGFNDIFFTRRWGTVYDTENFYQESYRRREQRHVRFTVTWKFGEQSTSLFRRGKQQRRDPGAEGGEMEGF